MSFRVVVCSSMLILLGCGSSQPVGPQPPVVFPSPQPVAPIDRLRVRADSGNPIAQYNLGLKLDGEERHAEAARYFRMAALQNVPEAQFNFALMQAEGVGMPKNEEEAFLMFKKAAVKGLAQAQYNVGIFLAEGRGTARSVPESIRWLRQAAVKGHTSARVYMAGLLLRGEIQGLNAQQVAETATWINDEALRGGKQAQFYMGLMTARGVGVQPDAAEAYFWFELAAKQNVAPAASGRELLAEQLTTAQVKQARDRAAQFKPVAPPVAPPRR
jgi:TPR repeat protein